MNTIPDMADIQVRVEEAIEVYKRSDAARREAVSLARLYCGNVVVGKDITNTDVVVVWVDKASATAEGLAKTVYRHVAAVLPEGTHLEVVLEW